LPRFSDHTIEEIKNRLTIKDVASDYTQIFHRGSADWIKCPFHGGGNERTPSCKLNSESGSYYCFGCHEHGSMFDFVMKMEHVQFGEAVEMLADRCGVEVEKMTEAAKKEKDTKDSLFELYERIQKTFTYYLKERPEGEKAREYVKKRRISDGTADKFLLGYAPADPSWLWNFLSSKGYGEEFLSSSGFFSKNNPKYPLFVDRLMFPVRNWQGRIIAFGARDLSGRENAPKYINTPETAIYSKKHNLYGFYEGLPEIKKAKSAIVCEGNFDAISLQQAGLLNAVAPFGTAFTSEQADLLARYCDTIMLLFDSDGAGQNATEKAITMLQGKNISVRVLSLKGAKDSSELLEREGEDALRKALGQSVSGFDWLTKKASAEYNVQTPKGMTGFVSCMSPFLQATESTVERSGYIKAMSEILGVDENAILHDIKYSKERGNGEYRANAKSQGEEIKRIRPFDPSMVSRELRMMLTLANNRELFPEFSKEFSFGDIKADKEAQIIYVALEDARRRGGVKTDELFLTLIDDEQAKSDVAASFDEGEFKAENARDIVEEDLRRVKIDERTRQIGKIDRQLSAVDREGGSSESRTRLLEDRLVLFAEIKQLKKELSKLGDEGIKER